MVRESKPSLLAPLEASDWNASSFIGGGSEPKSKIKDILESERERESLRIELALSDRRVLLKFCLTKNMLL